MGHSGGADLPSNGALLEVAYGNVRPHISAGTHQNQDFEQSNELRSSLHTGSGGVVAEGGVASTS